MKKLLEFTLVTLVTTIICYAAFAFVQGRINPLLWPQDIRSWLVADVVFLVGTILSYRHYFPNNKKDTNE